MLETLNYARFYAATDPNTIYACQNANGIACDGSVLAPGTNWTVNYFSQGTSAFGVLNDYASVFLTGDNSLGGFPSFESTGARSGYRDTYTIAGGSGMGTIDFTFAVTGTTTQSGGASSGGDFQFVPIVNGQEDFGELQQYGVVNGVATIPVSFTFNQPIEFTIYFYALAQVAGWVPGSSATADFSRTAILDQTVVHDSQGQIVPNFSIESASGTAYGANGVIPEPATTAFVASSLVLFWFCRAVARRRDI